MEDARANAHGCKSFNFKLVLCAWLIFIVRQKMLSLQKTSRREAVRIGELWKKAIELGMSEREIICLQEGYSRRELAEIWKLSLGRVSQIRAKAMRKMRHPWRRRLAIELGLAKTLGFSDAYIEKYKNRPIDEMPAYHVFRRNTPYREIEEEA